MRKNDADGMPKKNQAYLVGKGFSQHFEVNIRGIFATTVTLNAVHVLMAITYVKLFHFHSLDVKIDFQHALFEEE